MFWLHCGLFVLVIAVPGFISSADSTSKRGNACLPACLFVYLLARFYLSLSLSLYVYPSHSHPLCQACLFTCHATTSSSPLSCSLIEPHSFDLYTVNCIYRKSARRVGWKRGHASWESGWPLLTSPPPLPSFLPWFMPVGTRSCNFPRPWLRALLCVCVYIYISLARSPFRLVSFARKFRLDAWPLIALARSLWHGVFRVMVRYDTIHVRLPVAALFPPKIFVEARILSIELNGKFLGES